MTSVRSDADLTPLPGGYAIRSRLPADDPALVAIENRASELFRAHGYGSVADASIPDVEALRAMIAGQDVKVAVDDSSRPVGYAVFGALGELLHLRELSVDPAHGRRGLGSTLVAAAIDAARRGNYAGVSLTTFRDVPFNAPFYRRLGFREVELMDATEALRTRFFAEVLAGIEPASRVLMIAKT